MTEAHKPKVRVWRKPDPKKLTSGQRAQRELAAQRSAERRMVAELLTYCDVLKSQFQDLSRVNYPPLRSPVGRSTSVIQIGTARGNDGDEDPSIARYLASARLELSALVNEGRRLRQRDQ